MSSTTTLAFLNAINWEGFDHEVADTLRRADVTKVELIKSQTKWVVHLSMPNFLGNNDLQMFGNELCDLAQGITTVEIVPTYPTWQGTLQDWFDKYWDLLYPEFLNHISGLSSARFVVKNGMLIGNVVNEVGLQFLKTKNADVLIQSWIFDRFAFEVKIEFIIDEIDGNEEYLNRVQNVEKEFLAKLKIEDNKTVRQTSQSVIFGRGFKNEGVPLKDVQDEERSIVVQGQIFDLDTRLMKSGRTLVTFNLSDNTDSLAVKVFDEENGTLAQSPFLKNNAWIKARGPVQYDKYSQELTLMARDIITFTPVVRQDQAEEKRVELHMHTKMSTMDGVSTTSALITRAAAWGHPAIAITDHGVVQAFPEAVECAAREGIKLIYGVEAYLVDDDPNLAATFEQRKSRHCILLAKTGQGLYNLYQLITKSHLEYYHRTPRMPRSEIKNLREGLIVGSACEAGELIRAYLDGAEYQKLLEIAKFYDFLEIQPVGNNMFMVKNGRFSSAEDLREINRTIVRLGEELGIPVVATGDVHFLDPEDEVYRRILMAGKGFEDADDQAPLFLKTTEEMLSEFSYLGQEKAYEVVVANPRAIAEGIESLKPFPDELSSPIIPGAEEQIKQMTMDKAHELYGQPLPEIVEKRIDKELTSIINNGFSVLYLIAHLLVKKSNDDGYLVGSRGSVGSSLVATFTGITEVNPLPPHYRCQVCKYSEFITDGSYGSGADLPDETCPHCAKALSKDGHDIPFETFLGFKGDKVPDIDLNFSGDYQPRAHKYTEELFGKDYVFRAGTIATIADKTAFGFVKNYLEERSLKVRSAHMSRMVSGCTGVKRTTGQHPGGLMVVPKECDVHRFTPLQRPADDAKSEIITTHFDYHSISGRLVKLDILGHDDPTAIKMLEDITGVDALQIRLDDNKTMSLFSSPQALGVTEKEINSKTGTFGIPEFGTKFVRQMLEDTQPKTFSDLVRISGLSHGTDVWIGNAQELVRDGKAGISEIIACRDDIMVYLIYKGLEPSRAFKIMEGVRKGQGIKTDDIAEMKAKGVPDWYVDSCLKIKYMFPKAHAVAYVTMAFRIAWFKVNFPEAFYATFFTVRADEFDADLICQGVAHCRRRIEEIERKGNEGSAKDKNIATILELVVEMYSRGIKMRHVDLLQSDAEQFKITEDGLLPPFASLQGLGGSAAAAIVSARSSGGFRSVEDLRVNARLSKTVMEVLEKHGCLHGMPIANQISLF